MIAVSTFSGCGGSCLGVKRAGFRVVWANEFVAEARETYRANHPEVVLDERSIRDVDPEEILAVSGPVDLLEGSPPCVIQCRGETLRGVGGEEEVLGYA